MKRFIITFITIIMAFTLSACNAEEDIPTITTPVMSDTSITSGNKTITYDEADISEEEILNKINSGEFLSYIKTEDNLYKVNVSEEIYEEMCNSFKELIKTGIKDYVASSEFYEFDRIYYNETCEVFDVYVNSNTYSQSNEASILGMLLAYGKEYQNRFLNKSDLEISLVVNFINKFDKNIINSFDIKDYLYLFDKDAETLLDKLLKKSQNLIIGETQTIDDICEFTIESVNINKTINPPKASGYYNCYESQNGQVYIDICVKYKNLETQGIMADEIMSGTAYFGKFYMYDGFTVIEKDNRSDFTYSSITECTPLSTEYIHYLIPVSEDIETTDFDITIILSIQNQLYSIKVRDGKSCRVTQSEYAIIKTNGEIKNEVVFIEDLCEFYIEYSQITNRIEPPKANDDYGYYEAESGKCYIDVCIPYKNINNQSIIADDAIRNLKCTYAGKYEYTGFTIIEDENGSDFTYSSITSIIPLTTGYIHCLVEVPEEVSTSAYGVILEFDINGYHYSYKVK